MKTKYPFEMNSYRQEQVIIYDDVVPSLDEFIDVTETYKIQQHVWGESRYHNNYWKIGQSRFVIWLLNPQRLPDYARPGNDRYEIWKARFRVWVWNEKINAFEWKKDTPERGGDMSSGKLIVTM